MPSGRQKITNSMQMDQLIRKYNVPGPRYTSYPTVPFWNEREFSLDKWKQAVRYTFDTSNQNGISIYIHLPFCESMCTFCGCHKHITRQHTVEESYIDTLLKEWKLYLELFSERPVIKELHLGGGTPTFFSPQNLERLITTLFQTSTLHPDSELGFEGHPNNTTEAHLDVLHRLGFTRVSFGVQDYDPLVQSTINRIQPYENVERVHRLARKMGYHSISHDLVYGLPHQTEEGILETIRLTAFLRPDRISLYSYAHVPWIKGSGQRGFDESDLPKDEEKRGLYEVAKKALLRKGYREIGMDHFALESDQLYTAFRSKKLHRNFMGYTTNSTRLLVGLGMSAIGDSWQGFGQNAKSVKEYQNLVAQGKFPIVKGHILSHEDLEIRQHILNLMCQFETTWDEAFAAKTGFSALLDRLEPLLADGVATINGLTLKVTEKGKIFIRNICMCFDLHLHENEVKEQVFSKTI